MRATIFDPISYRRLENLVFLIGKSCRRKVAKDIAIFVRKLTQEFAHYETNCDMAFAFAFFAQY